ncbi:hypothetical protein SLOPH_1705 [Spraguea lophii 42_110]|uniref:Rad21/Rec8-like protein N-terminal domain-containing protein n=1 Tax=Spraguea lophii (strain 42_110) TaxID=1358809 RepID=S7WAQ2_SPRLO|nr:hypothetical protein SLOPH_1705 [Spraguea lophii 42_110]
MENFSIIKHDEKILKTEENKEIYTLWLQHITNKKVSKQYIMNIKLNAIIIQLTSMNIPLTKHSQLLSAISKIYYKQINYLLDDLNSIINIQRKKKSKPIHKNLTLSLQKLMLTDNMLQKPLSENIDEYLNLNDHDDTIIDIVDNTYNDSFNIDMGIENVRAETSHYNTMNISLDNDTILESRISDITQINIENNIKRIKLDDNKTEYGKEEYKKMLRNKKDIMNENKKDDMTMKIDIIPEFIKTTINNIIKNYNEIEIARNDTLVEIPDHSFNNSFNSINETNDNILEPLSLNSYSYQDDSYFNENIFSFNKIVENENNLKKTTMFIRLLKEITDGVFNVEQNKPYEEIICTRI